MNDVFKVADYIVKYCNEHNISITHSKLQSLLYFVQAEFLMSFNEPCFTNSMVALPYGPAVSDVLEHYEQYGIQELKSYNYGKSDLNHIKNINTVLKAIAKSSDAELTDVTQNQSPWRDAYLRGVGTEITTSSIRNFFTDDNENYADQLMF